MANEKKQEILQAIIRGDITSLRSIMKSHDIKLPQDLMGFDRNNTVLQLAAIYGQAEILQYFLGEIEYKDASGVVCVGFRGQDMVNQNGDRAIDVAECYGDKRYREAMLSVLKAADSLAAADQETASRAIRAVTIPEKLKTRGLSKKYSKFDLPEQSFTGRHINASGEDASDYAARIDLLNQYQEELNRIDRQCRENRKLKDEYLELARSDKLTKDDIVEFAQQGFSIDCVMHRPTSNGSKDDGMNALHYAIMHGNLGVAKALYEGVEVVGASGENKIVRIGFDKRAREVLDKAVSDSRGDPAKEAQFLKMKQYFDQPLQVTKLTMPKSPHPNEAKRLEELARVAGQAINI